MAEADGWKTEDLFASGTLTLGYTFPRQLPKQRRIEKVRLYVTGSNLLLFTKYTGPDPESSANSSQNQPGIDLGTPPQPRSVQFGINMHLISNYADQYKSTNMKAVKYILSFFITTSFISCKKFLDVEPKESISDEQTIFDKTSAEQAVRGVYSALASDGYYGTGFQSIGYLSGDNVQWTGSQSQIQEFINHNVSSENATISGAWTAIYRVINRANQVIAKVPGVQIHCLPLRLRIN